MTTPSGCAWTAVSNNPDWITIKPNSIVSGNGTVDYTVSANDLTSQRTGTLMIAGQTFTVIQSSCPTPGTPSSPSPSSGATGVSTSATLGWAASTNTDSYDVYFGTSASPRNVGNVTGTSYPVSGLSYSTTYYWKIVAKNNCGNSTPGTVWSFTTGAPMIGWSPTTLSFNATGGGSNPTPLTLSIWNAGGGTLNWTASKTQSWLTLSLTSGSSTGSGNPNQTTVSANISGLSTGTYNDTITISAPGASNTPQTVTVTLTLVCATPGTPSSPSPSSGATGVSTSPTLSWAATSNTDSYDIYWGTSSNPPYVGNTTSTSYLPSGLSYSTTYYWKIVAKNNCGNSTSGPLWSFTTGAAPCPTPGTPSSPSPSSGATGVSTSPTLSWAASSNTDSYDVYFGTSSSPPNVGNVTGTSYPVSGLSYSTTYYWKIVAKNNCGNSTPGPVWSFTTACPTPGTPSGPSPSSGATGISTSPTLGWAASSNTDSYDVYFGTPSGTGSGNASVASAAYSPPYVGNTSNTSYGVSGLSYSTLYYWKIVAKNNCGNSTSGPVWSFTTGAPD